jgi:hypothetical protein
MKILIEAPLNSLSLGNVSFNIIRELIGRGHDVGIWPTGKIDLKAYDINDDLKKKIENSINNRYNYLSSDVPSLKIWHLNGSENRKNSNQYLLTFYECNQPTDIEKKISSSQTQTFFSSSCAAELFGDVFCPLGFDKDFKKTEKEYLSGITHFGLMGKFEHRKHTAKIIQTWLKKYGNDPKYQLSCLVTNPFYKKEDMDATINAVLGGGRYTNINFLPHLEKNSEVNEFLNAIDIDLTGLSGAEGWNLPAFNATCLGKWSIILNATSHKDWATKDNSILVEPSGEVDCYDEVFFKKGSPFNQGTFYDWNEEDVINAMEQAEKKVGQVNTEGQKLADKLTYENTVDVILARISKDFDLA